MVLVTHHLVARRVRENSYPSPDELRAPDTRPFGPVALEYHALHAHGQASSHRGRSLTTLTSASKVRRE
jgi:hypothetical protein